MDIETLYDAALWGDNTPFQQVDPLILERCIMEKWSNYTRSLLHVASAKCHLPIIETLVDAAPEMCFAYDQNGNTPVHVAAVKGHGEALQLFLDKQPLAVREPTSRGETVLHLCAKFDHPDLLRSLLGIREEATQDAQIDIPATGNVRSEQRQNNNSGYSPTSMCLERDQNGRTPIHVAAANGHIAALEELHRANIYAVHEKTSNGESILHLCVKHNQFQALKKLIELNKEDDDGDQLINSKDNNGNTILHLAVTCKQHEMVKHILEKCKSRIEINALNNENMTVLDLCKRLLGDRQIGKSLMRAGVVLAEDHDVDWFERQRSGLMVVASLIATIAFHIGVKPPVPGGKHEAAGFNFVLACNTIGFVLSLSVMMVLISGIPVKRQSLITVLMAALGIAVMGTFVTYIQVLRHVTVQDPDPLLSPLLGVCLRVWPAFLILTFVIRKLFKIFFYRNSLHYSVFGGSMPASPAN